MVDINRDAHQQVHETTKSVHRMFHEWHPTVVHDLHEGVPLMMTWNGTGPYNPNVDPITYSEFLALSFHEVQAMTAMGMPGVSTWNFGEAFAQISNDGRWALFSSYWDGTLGSSKGDFGIGTRIDTFIVELVKPGS